MSDKPITTSWMWAVDDGVQGLVIERGPGIMRWYDGIGCACSDNDWSVVQPLADYGQEGPPAGFTAVPADVRAEVEASVQALTAMPPIPR